MVRISGGNGTSYENAIVITNCSHFEGVDQEYIELRRRFGNYKLIKQSLIEKDEKNYDLLEIQLENGIRKLVYFDITEFFGKGFDL
ncbi:MAG: hypothetical protein ACFFEO_09625 [Candidatus Thorarchaeota archaeon]